MSPETKKHLYLGGGLIAAIVVGIIAYKKIQVNSQASSAAGNQANQDQLAYLESMISNPYAQASVGTVDNVGLPAAPATPSITDQLAAIEQAFGLAPAVSTTPASTSTPSSARVAPSAPSGSKPVAKSMAVPASTVATTYLMANELPTLRSEGIPIA